MSQEKCKLFENILLLKLEHKKNDKRTGLNNSMLSTHEFGSCKYIFSTYYFSRSLTWIASLPCEERPTTFTTHWRTGWKQSAPSLLAWGPAEWVTESLILARVCRPTSLQGSPLGTDYNHLLRAIPLTRQIKSYKLSNRKNTRTTGQNDQILNHARNL